MLPQKVRIYNGLPFANLFKTPILDVFKLLYSWQLDQPEKFSVLQSKFKAHKRSISSHHRGRNISTRLCMGVGRAVCLIQGITCNFI